LATELEMAKQKKNRDMFYILYMVTFEEACSPDSMICTRGCNYGFMYSWWWARWTPETCRV